MIYRHYEETYHTLSLIGDEEGTWVSKSLVSLGVPPNSVVEIALINCDSVAEHRAGVRKSGSAVDRIIDIHEAEAGGVDGIGLCTQVDAHGKVEFFSESNGSADDPNIQFHILGYWLGVEYTELFETFVADTNETWDNKSLTGYGVSGGQVAEVVGVNTDNGLSRDIGIRTSGSLLDRHIDIHEAEAGGVDGITMSVVASGDTAAIQVYAEDVPSVEFYLVGYWSSPPGEYHERLIDIGAPDGNGGEDGPALGTWYGKSLNESGIPANSVGEFALGNGCASDENWVGVRESGSTLGRALELHEIDAGATGFDTCRMCASINASADIEFFYEDVSETPYFSLLGYWDNFVGCTGIAVQTATCFIEGRNQHVHYTELSTTYIETTPADTWNTFNVNDYGVPLTNDIDPVVVELVLLNSRGTVSYLVGARSVGSSLDRRFSLHEAVGYSNDHLSLFVPVDDSGNIEVYADNDDYNKFQVAGFWCGATYVEANDIISATGDAGWESYDLGTQYANKIVDVVVANTDTTAQIPLSGGVRQVGSNLDRHHVFDKVSDTGGKDYVTMQVRASGTDGTIQLYAEIADDIEFTVVGYWDFSPGTYHEAFSDVGPSTVSDQWEPLDVGVAEGSVCEIVLENRSNSHLDMGIREVYSSYDDKYLEQRDINVAADTAASMMRVHVNMTSGTYAEFYQDNSSSTYAYRLIGYWDNLSRIPLRDNGTVGLFTHGHKTPNVLEEADYPSGLQMYIDGIPVAKCPLFTMGPRRFEGNGNMFLQVPESCLSSGSMFLSGPHLVGTSGISGMYPGISHEDGGPSSPLFISGPEQYADNGNLFIKVREPCSNSMNLYTKVFDQLTVCHYIEDFRTWTPLSKDTWETQDLASWVPDVSDITAEIMICNSGEVNADTLVGVRTAGSLLDRRVSIAPAEPTYGGYNAATMHVQLSGTKIECYAPSGVNFYLMGYWVGAEYQELAATILPADPTSTWNSLDLDSAGVPSGAIVEVLEGQSYGNQLQGVRSVGNPADRKFKWIGGDHASERYSFWTSMLQTSGANATIQKYHEFTNTWQPTVVVGYWKKPPGDYTDLYQQNEANPTVDSTWESVSLSGVPSGAVASIGIITNENEDSRVVGVRSKAVKLERKIGVSAAPLSTRYVVTDMQVNANSDIEVYSEDATGDRDNFTLFGYWDNFIDTPLDLAGSSNLYVGGVAPYTTSGDLVTCGHQSFNSNNQYPSGVSLHIYGIQTANADLFTHGLDIHQVSGNLFTHGVFGYATNVDDCPNYPSGVQLYSQGSGIIPHNDRHDLFIRGYESIKTSGDLFAHGIAPHVSSGDLFLKAIEPQTASLNLFVYNPVDPGPGLIREPNAVFYLKYYHDGQGAAGDITEFVQDQAWYVPAPLFQHTPFIGTSGKTVAHVADSILAEPFVPTPGDGTYPHYDDLGGYNYREAMDTDYRTPGGGWQSTKMGYYESERYKQNICGETENYGYAGSGSFTTVFWMSGAHTSGNVAEVGWFRKSLPEDLDIALASHTLGIRIESESGITVITNVRDVPYEQPSGGGLWWGGTTHYGTPSGSTWEWNTEVTGLYRTWEEEWPTTYIDHDPIVFVALHADFIASGIDGSHPNHMKVYLSLDGQPWTYVGSGLTGPPASSLYSYSDPTNRRAENCVGVRQQGVNITGGIIPAEMGGVKQGSIILAENVLWTDAGRFTTDELRDLYSIVDTYNRPLDEYRPTIVPPSTYIQRTVGAFAYDPTIPGVGYNPGEICSGLRVTIEVGLGAYGADASAYLLEETPPSGFYIGNIQPFTSTTYHSQGPRPNGGEQIFHDPQSGVLQPYNDEVNLNSYGASIRWVNHDNHPEINQRRSPTPTGIYSYDLFPVHYHGVPRVDDFSFTGSGVFFGGSTGSGIFVIETTGDTAGTTSGLTGGLASRGCNLYMQGPLQNSGTANLYLRTQESFTSAYIGTSPRTPELTDFIFAADGAAAIESMAGIEYGPPLYTRGPLQYEDTCPLVIFGPVADDVDFYIQGHRHVDTSGNYPSGMLLRIGDGHEEIGESGTLFIVGPQPHSSGVDLYTMAGVFTSVGGGAGHGISPPLYILGHNGSSGNCDLFIKGPEFICSSGSFSYPGDPDDFTYPYGDPSPTLYTYGYDQASGTCPLFIGTGRQWGGWTLYLKTDDNDKTESLDLFINGFTLPSGSSGINRAFNNVKLYLEAADADYPYTAGGTEAWTLFMKAQEGNLTSDEAWTMFLKADFTVPKTCSLYIRGHAPGQPPDGIEITGSVGLICSVNPDDPTRIGFQPHDSHDDPWSLFLRCDPGWFGTATLYMSGAVPIVLAASGNLFVEGLFEQETDTLPLYLMGVSGMFNNGPSGLHLFLDAGTLVYNTSGNLYSHGY
ncbi:MAG: hypothetical protein DRJ03_00415 [Chloroflexi bacterium]|nr:MAG: hypothetical protein DRJ03_00415 [Chloroflexota bacterium]